MNGECSGTGKVRFATARAAYQAMGQVRWGRQTKVQPRRVYYCKHCQGYHLSSKGDVWGRRGRLTTSKKRVRQDEAEPKPKSRRRDRGDFSADPEYRGSGS